MRVGDKMNVVTSEPVSVWKLGAPLGEGPVWVERDQALWFVDIKSHKIHRYDPASGATRSWDAPGQIGFIGTNLDVCFFKILRRRELFFCKVLFSL